MPDSLLTPTEMPTDPLSENECIQWVQLIRSRRVGPATFWRLIGEFGSAGAALQALPDIAKKAGVESYRICSKDAAKKELDLGRAAGATLLLAGSSGYAELLASIPDAPPLIWVKGRVDMLKPTSVALVGGRNASSIGTRMARKIADELSVQKIVVVSGLARGIDTAAHLGALEGGTIAVMAGGIDVIYPRENTQLAAEIAENGLLLTEQPPGLAPQARHFPTRNRLISGLSTGVVVVEGAAKSGSLITAQAALEQGREVMAVPGHPFDGRAVGCNNLIRDGAVLVRSGTEVIQALSARNAPPKHPQNAPQEPQPARTDTSETSARILALLSPTPIPEDQLIRELSLPAAEVAPQLIALELDGKLSRQSGGMLALAV